MNITAPLRRLARLIPDTPAVIRADDTVLTYAMLDRAIDRVAARTAAHGLGPGDPIGLPITGPDESLGLILALALARRGIASADPALPACRRIVAGPTPDPDAFDLNTLCDPATEAAPEVPIDPDPAALFRVFASSGTTGRPKPVAISHGLVARRVFANILAPGGPDPCARIVALDLGIVWGFTAVLRTLWQGGTLVLTNPREAVTRIPRHRVRTIVTSPSGLRALLDALPPESRPFPGLETIEIGGSALPGPLRDAAIARLCPGLISHLGSTEAGGIASTPIAALGSRPGAIGFVNPDVTVEVVDPDHRPLPPGTEGMLRVGGPLVVAGYEGAAEATAASFRDGWFYPGDLGTVWADGMLCLAGRESDVINCGGVKISTNAVEAVLLSLPGVSDAAAFGVPDAVGLIQLWAAIVAPGPIGAAELSRFCAARLPGQVPRMILQMKALPRNANGKVRKDLLAAYARTQTPPRD